MKGVVLYPSTPPPPPPPPISYTISLRCNVPARWPSVHLPEVGHSVGTVSRRAGTPVSVLACRLTVPIPVCHRAGTQYNAVIGCRRWGEGKGERGVGAGGEVHGWVVQYLYTEPLGRDPIQCTGPAPRPRGVGWGGGRGGGGEGGRGHQIGIFL